MQANPPGNAVTSVLAKIANWYRYWLADGPLYGCRHFFGRLGGVGADQVRTAMETIEYIEGGRKGRLSKIPRTSTMSTNNDCDAKTEANRQ